MNIALILAAGSGSRMNCFDRPKQFILVNNKPLFIYSAETFNFCPLIDKIIVVTNKEYVGEVNNTCDRFGLNKVSEVVAGGSSRNESVYNGLQAAKAISTSGDDIVLIHDAARPLVTEKIISENIEACLKYHAVDTVISVSDTIISSDDGLSISKIPNRKLLYQSQTPQTFKLSLILEAHEQNKRNPIENITDDAKLVLALGKEVHLVEGKKQNFKITTQDDLVMFKAIIKNM